ncbi:Transcriptional regulator [Frankia canadensis]|uniref:Transcriptional regulator n=1 Tax=Frankia canadensis TaxID=1836972 RepID=A0A2I2KWQ5_9ACTN|nr:MarR family transcriptional regulator [Frankia canadensis]SNQ50082.1 Transcriptional regulator [Frankia canadensis]SOU57372.1 Transcriptional regulator [Frankia canadensis]
MSPETRIAGGPDDSPGFLLWRLTLRWQRALTDVLAPLELTHVQFVLLACTWWLGEQGERPHQVAIAAQAGTDVRMTSEVLRRLEARGLVQRVMDVRDTRARVISVTSDGAALARRAITVVDQADADFFAGVSPSFVSQMRRLAAYTRAAGPATAGAGQHAPHPAASQVAPLGAASHEA